MELSCLQLLLTPLFSSPLMISLSKTQNMPKVCLTIHLHQIWAHRLRSVFVLHQTPCATPLKVAPSCNIPGQFKGTWYTRDSGVLCCQNGYIWWTFPQKGSHLIQPLDILFGILKSKIDAKASEAFRLKIPASRSQISILLWTDVEAMPPDRVKKALKNQVFTPSSEMP